MLAATMRPAWTTLVCRASAFAAAQAAGRLRGVGLTGVEWLYRAHAALAAWAAVQLTATGS